MAASGASGAGRCAFIVRSCYPAYVTAGCDRPVTVAGVALTGTHADRYTVSQPTGITSNVTAATVTVSGITVPTRAYDTTSIAVVDVTDHVLSGVVSGDVAALDASNYTATYNSAGVANGKSVSVSGLALSGADAGNYVLTQPVLQGNIVKASASVLYNAVRTTTYNGTPRPLSATTSPSSLVVTHSYSGNNPTVYGPTSAPPTNARDSVTTKAPTCSSPRASSLATSWSAPAPMCCSQGRP